MSDLAPGDVIDGRYRVVEVLGAGSMGVVLAVEHVELQVPFALKLLSSHLQGTPGVEARFLREARIAGALDDPRLVKVTDFGRIGARPYLVMERVDGESLRVASEAMSPRQRIETVVELLEGLSAAHHAGLVHRDLKPDNVLVTRAEGRVKILDFGLARLDGMVDDVRTAEGAVFGTPRYMAPEQAVGDKADYRVDIYAVGVLLFELLAEAPPYDAADASEILRLHLVKPLPPLAVRGPATGIDVRRLQTVLHTAMAKAREDRFESAEAMLQELKACLSPGAPRPERSWPILARDVRQRLSPLFDPMLRERGIRALLQLELPALQLPTIEVMRTHPRLTAVAGLGVAAMLAAAFLPRPASEEPPPPLRAPAPGPAAPALAPQAPTVVESDEALTALDRLAAGQSEALASLTATLTATALRRTVEEARAWIARPDRDRIKQVLTSVSQAAPRGGRAPAFLLELTLLAPSFALRREAYEGLERHGWAQELNQLAYLKDQLRRNGTHHCRIRRWYVERLIALDEPSIRPVLIAERNRRGGFLNLERVNRCLRADIDAALARLPSPTHTIREETGEGAGLGTIRVRARP